MLHRKSHPRPSLKFMRKFLRKKITNFLKSLHSMLLLLLIFYVFCQGENWAVLIAGSRGYDNFRHQADVCEAFQQLKSQGIPEDRIIVFMDDDIAHNLRNPHKGSIINYPGGPNVYAGVPHDYTGLHVTPHNFLKVLKGESMSVGTKKTLKSTENDNVFVYFADHGAPGILAFPWIETLHAKDLNEAIEYMSKNKMFKNLVFYVEACESGSMFNGILKTPNVYAVTASNPFESSWACDYDSKYDAYLNDCWSNDWMANSRDAIAKKEMSTRTLGEQFEQVHNVSTKSPECAYGDLTLQKMTLMDFQGQANSDVNEEMETGSIRNILKLLRRKHRGKMRRHHKNHRHHHGRKHWEMHSQRPRSMVSSRNVKFEDLARNLKNGGDWKSKFEKHVQERKMKDQFWQKFRDHFGIVQQQDNKYDPADHCYKEEEVIDLDCNKNMVVLKEHICGRFTEYELKHIRSIHMGCKQQKLDETSVKQYFLDHC